MALRQGIDSSGGEGQESGEGEAVAPRLSSRSSSSSSCDASLPRAGELGTVPLLGSRSSSNSSCDAGLAPAGITEGSGWSLDNVRSRPEGWWEEEVPKARGGSEILHSLRHTSSSSSQEDVDRMVDLCMRFTRGASAAQLAAVEVLAAHYYASAPEGEAPLTTCLSSRLRRAKASRFRHPGLFLRYQQLMGATRVVRAAQNFGINPFEMAHHVSVQRRQMQKQQQRRRRRQEEDLQAGSCSEVEDDDAASSDQSGSGGEQQREPDGAELGRTEVDGLDCSGKTRGRGRAMGTRKRPRSPHSEDEGVKAHAVAQPARGPATARATEQRLGKGKEADLAREKALQEPDKDKDKDKEREQGGKGRGKEGIESIEARMHGETRPVPLLREAQGELEEGTEGEETEQKAGEGKADGRGEREGGKEERDTPRQPGPNKVAAATAVTARTSKRGGESRGSDKAFAALASPTRPAATSIAKPVNQAQATAVGDTVPGVEPTERAPSSLPPTPTPPPLLHLQQRPCAARETAAVVTPPRPPTLVDPRVQFKFQDVIKGKPRHRMLYCIDEVERGMETAPAADTGTHTGRAGGGRGRGGRGGALVPRKGVQDAPAGSALAGERVDTAGTGRRKDCVGGGKGIEERERGADAAVFPPIRRSQRRKLYQ